MEPKTPTKSKCGSCANSLCCCVSLSSPADTSFAGLAAHEKDYQYQVVLNSASEDEVARMDAIMKGNRLWLLRWPHCVAWTLVSVLVLCLVVALTVFLWLVPHLAQQSARDSSMVHSDVVIFNISEHSLWLNATMTLSNSGQCEASIHSTAAELHSRCVSDCALSHHSCDMC